MIEIALYAGSIVALVGAMVGLKYAVAARKSEPESDDVEFL